MPGRAEILALLCLAVTLAPAMPASAAQARAAIAPIYPGPDGSPHYLIGVTATGSPADLDRLAKAAASQGWPTARDLSTDGQVSLVIGFPGANAAQVEAFLKRAAAGEFGKFTFESAMAPVSGAPKR